MGVTSSVTRRINSLLVTFSRLSSLFALHSCFCGTGEEIGKRNAFPSEKHRRMPPP
jgi:hypothetical protein